MGDSEMVLVKGTSGTVETRQRLKYLNIINQKKAMRQSVICGTLMQQKTLPGIATKSGHY